MLVNFKDSLFSFKVDDAELVIQAWVEHYREWDDRSSLGYGIGTLSYSCAEESLSAKYISDIPNLERGQRRFPLSIPCGV
jgi:hypothetical protein